MATNKINKNIISGTPVKVVTSGTVTNAVCTKVDGVVTAYGAISSMSDEAGNAAYFNLPLGFRPSGNVVGMALFKFGTNEIVYPCVVNAYGNVGLSYSSQASMKEFSFFIMFKA